ncbi:hypothetical protein [Stigmatella aurantiaca]|uniref:Conserved uncharacterized protein n=1 Tax=Stigmatella aurantiaca (strain DW4/3-1) TaxID=378806 RepID=Q08ZT5_STIAD|nr:hypothetical protein [Stigmatella aurantiaca]ADO74800.1 conserved uncharacterized protein [Stigmatella aurantiaca DW4/3-1]EAU65986.1 hypothetical protein STIAU_8458 [Stigmatella aurantiaca DW4/3-1]
MKKLFLCCIAMTMVLGCSNESADRVDETEGFTLLRHDATALEATYRSGGTSVRALVTESSPNVIEVTYDFGESIVGFRIDYNQGVGRFMPSGNPLDAAQSRLINGLAEGLEKAVPETERTRIEDTAMRQTSFMQIVPVGETLTPYQYVAERGWVHLSCTCGNQNIGGYTRQAGRGCSCNGGDNGCKGRCGQGCGITSTPKCVGTTAYTQDCAKHDYGLGSFAAASDDYSFASNNCSCSGVGTCY